jgi:hypothetical protein
MKNKFSYLNIFPKYFVTLSQITYLKNSIKIIKINNLNSSYNKQNKKYNKKEYGLKAIFKEIKVKNWLNN